MTKNDLDKLREETRVLFNDKFGDIVFEEIPHKYTIDGVEYTPVSTIISQYENEFDTELRSKSYAEKNGLLQEDVKRSWKWTNKCATIMGTRAHEFGESYTNLLSGHKELICEQNKGQFVEDENWLVPTFPQEFAVKSFYDELNPNLHPIGAEFKLSTKYIDGAKPICGTADILFYYDAPNPDNSGFVIGDWKGLDVNTPILTTNGWKTMGTVNVGDVVYDKDGEQCKVLHTSEIHHRKCYKMTFEEDDTIISDNEHRWLVTLDNDEDKVMTSEELYGLWVDNFHKVRDEKSLFPRIRVCKAIKNTKKELPIDPYTLGRWLCDNEMENENELLDKLKELKLIDNKHIPDTYMLASFEQRLELLRGITDSVGHYKENGIILDVNEEWMHDAFRMIISSLGYKVMPLTVPSKNKLYFLTNYNPFSVDTVEELNDDMRSLFDFKHFINIEEVDSVPTRCIEVDSPTHTFLCGHNFLVTHNTNRELTKDFVRNTKMMMLPPFDNMYDEALSHYYIQFNLYQRMMESIGLKVIARRLVHIKRDGTYEVHSVPKIDDKIINEILMENGE